MVIDGEHYPPVVAAALDGLRRRYDVVAGIFAGGREKLRGGFAAAPDLVAASRLEFRAPDETRFPALRIAREAGLIGSRATAALIAADEVGVARFLDGTLDFPGIPRLLEAAVARFGTGPGQAPGYDELVDLDREVRAAFSPPGTAGERPA